MGTCASTIIQNKNNGIGLYTRWDGFTKEIKNNILNSESIWENTFSKIKEQLSHLPVNHPSQSLQAWVQSYENFKQLPYTIEKQSCLLSGLSFNHHYIVNENSDYWDISVQKDNDKFTFKRIKAMDFNNKKLVPVDIPENYSLVKSLEIVDDKEECSYFKVKDFSRTEFLNMMTSLPNFWAKFLMLDELSVGEYSKEHFLSSWKMKLLSFTTSRYERESKPIEILESYFNDTIGNASAMIPFDFYYRKLYLHLFMQNPDKIQPLTFGEEKFLKSLSPEQLEKKIVAKVENISLMRLNAFGISFPEEKLLTSDEANLTLENFFQEKKQIADFLEMEPIVSIPDYTDRFNGKKMTIPPLYQFNSDENMILIHYELALLQNLYLLEKNKEKQKLNSKKTIRNKI